jgi:hypothetical protein
MKHGKGSLVCVASGNQGIRIVAAALVGVASRGVIAKKLLRYGHKLVQLHGH